MVSKNFANINLKILQWVIDASEFSIEDIAKKTKISLNTLNDVLMGEKKLTQNQLYNISHFFRRPAVIFYLAEIPELYKLPDFRRTPDYSPGISRELDIKIRNIRTKKKFAEEMYIEFNHHFDYEYIERIGKIVDINEIGNEVRKLLNVETKDLIGINNNNVLNYWKSKLEGIGILIFQFSLDREVSRGFSFAEQPYPLIAINSKDTYYARAFTIFHEFAHILLNKNGICDKNNEKFRNDLLDIEALCNKIANAILVPQNEFIDEFRKRRNLDKEKIISQLSVIFKVSHSVILNNINSLNIITPIDYNRLFEKLKYKPPVRTGRGPAPHKTELSRNSKLFLKTIMTGLENRTIAFSQARKYFNVSSKLLHQMEEEYRIREQNV